MYALSYRLKYVCQLVCFLGWVFTLYRDAMLEAEREKLKKEMAEHKSLEEILAENQKKIEVRRALMLILLCDDAHPYERCAVPFCAEMVTNSECDNAIRSQPQ